MLSRLLKPLALGLLATTLSVACTTPPQVASTAAPTVETMLHDLGRTVILPTYGALSSRADALYQRVTALKEQPTEANLLAAREAWRAARAPWEMSESHLLGPVKDQELDPKMDSWPLNQVDLDNVLSSNAVLVEAFIAEQADGVKGFHAMEYLLFKNDSASLSASPRKLEYLLALAADFKTTTHALREAWEPSGGNFLDQYEHPGAGRTFDSSKAALSETLLAMQEICEEVANSKIENPLAENDKSQEESQFSGNSMEDFVNNLAGVQNMYLGTYDGKQGVGLGALVANNDLALDAKTRTLIAQAIADLKAVPGPFAEAMDSEAGRQALRKAQTSILAVRDILKKDISLSLLGAVSADPT
ncbi:Iron-regulated protein A precursor [compost metagenome]